PVLGSLRLPADHQPELRRYRDGHGLAASPQFSSVGAASGAVRTGLRLVHARPDCLFGRGTLLRRAARSDDLRPDLCEQCDRRGARLVRWRSAARPHRRLPRGAGDVAGADHGGRAAVLDRAGAAQLPLARYSSSCWMVRFASRRRWLSSLPRLETSLIAVAGDFVASAANFSLLSA